MEQIAIKIENHARSSEIEIVKGINTSDFGILLASVAFLPLAGNHFLGLDWKMMLLPGVVYLLYVLRFKVGKPRSYFRHYLSYKFRDTLWRAENIYSEHQYELINRCDIVSRADFNKKLEKNREDFLKKDCLIK